MVDDAKMATGAGDHGGVVRFPRDVMVGLVPLLIKSPLVVVGRVRLVVGGGGVPRAQELGQVLGEVRWTGSRRLVEVVGLGEDGGSG